MNHLLESNVEEIAPLTFFLLIKEEQQLYLIRTK